MITSLRQAGLATLLASALIAGACRAEGAVQTQSAPDPAAQSPGVSGSAGDARPGGKHGSAVDEAAIKAGIETIRNAALASAAALAAPLLATDIALVSQSGKVHGRDAVLADFANKFVMWENSDLSMHRSGDAMVVTYINHRQRENMAPARFRVLQLWTKAKDAWRLSAQSSTRIAD